MKNVLIELSGDSVEVSGDYRVLWNILDNWDIFCNLVKRKMVMQGIMSSVDDTEYLRAFMSQLPEGPFRGFKMYIN